MLQKSTSCLQVALCLAPLQLDQMIFLTELKEPLPLEPQQNHASCQEDRQLKVSYTLTLFHVRRLVTLLHLPLPQRQSCHKSSRQSCHKSMTLRSLLLHPLKHQLLAHLPAPVPLHLPAPVLPHLPLHLLHPVPLLLLAQAQRQAQLPVKIHQEASILAVPQVTLPL